MSSLNSSYSKIRFKYQPQIHNNQSKEKDLKCIRISVRKMPKKGRQTVKLDETIERRSIKDIKENLDDKTRRKVDYLLKDFRLQRKCKLEEIEEDKQDCLDKIDNHFKTTRILPVRTIRKKVSEFKTEKCEMIITFQDRNELFKKRRDPLKAAIGTPKLTPTYTVTYSATKRKSHIKNFELKHVLANGHSKTIISSAKKSSRKSFLKRNNLSKDNSGSIVKSILNPYFNPSSSSIGSQSQNSIDEERQLKDKMKKFRLTKVKEDAENTRRHLDRLKEEQFGVIDNLFTNILSSLTEEQAKQKISVEEQKRIVQHLFGC